MGMGLYIVYKKRGIRKLKDKRRFLLIVSLFFLPKIILSKVHFYTLTHKSLIVEISIIVIKVYGVV